MRFDAGYYVVDVSRLIANEDLVDWALSTSDVYVATSPSIVSVKTPWGATLVALGVGSLVSRERPPAWYRVLARPEWIGSCGPLAEPRMEVLQGAVGVVDGVSIALEYRDPVALLGNGVKGIHIVAENGRTPSGFEPYLVVEGKTLLYGGPEGYLLAARGGPAFERLRTAGLVLSACNS